MLDQTILNSDKTNMTRIIEKWVSAIMIKSRFLFMALLACVSFIAIGQDHTIQFGYDTTFTNGNFKSFTNQYQFGEGFYLDQLKLDFNKVDTRFQVLASGIGDRPTQRASILFQKKGVYKLGLRYLKKDFDFHSPEYEVGMRDDQWSHTQLTAFMEYLGWSRLNLSLEVSQWQREGSISRPVYGLGIPYIIKTEFDDQNSDMRIKLETKKMPVKIRFEQVFAEYTRDNTYQPGQSLIQDDDVLLEIDGPGEDRRDSPATSLSAYYESEKWAVDLGGIWRKDQVDILRKDFSNYGLSNGVIGQLGFLHDVTGDSEREARQLRSSFGFKISDKWTLRLRYTGFDQTTENQFLELFQLIVQGPAGQTIFESEFADQSEWEKNDKTLYSQLEYHNDSTRVAFSWGERTREITHLTLEASESVEREAENLRLDVSHRFSKNMTSKIGASIGDYSDFIFRIQPEEVDRYWLRLKAGLRKGWSLSLKAAIEDAVNPVEQASLDRSQSQVSVNLSYSHKNNYLTAGITQQSFSSEIALNDIPGNTVNNPSIYDSELIFATLNGSFEMGSKARLNLSLSRSADSGDTMPFKLTQLQSSLEFTGPFNTFHWLTIQSWSYENDVFESEDYDMMRFGYKIGWRF